MFEYLSPHGIIAAALTAPPGPDVLTALAGINLADLDANRTVDFMVALDRQKGWLEALDQLAVVRVGDALEHFFREQDGDRYSEDYALRSTHCDIAVALRVDDNYAANKLHLAQTLTRRLPTVHAVLATGEISLSHARAIADATFALTVDKARRVADRVLPRARRQTVAQLRRSLKRAVIAVEPTSAAQRAKEAHAERSLFWRPLDDGMAELRLITSASDVMTLYSIIDKIAQHAKASGPKPGQEGFEPIDALRADALVTLLTQGSNVKVKPPAVNVTIDLPTLLALQDNPAELAGYGPIPANLARALAADGKWRRMILDPQTGHLLDLGHTSYRPSAALARFVKTRDRTCTIPTCSRAAHHSDIDHQRPYRPNDPAGGGTDRINLHPPCKNHHILKHKGRWTLRTNPDTGQHYWHSPSGHEYPITPIDHRPEPADEDRTSEAEVSEPTGTTDVSDVCPF